MNSGGTSVAESGLDMQSECVADNQAAIYSSPLMGSDPSSITTASIIRSGQLPQPQLGIIGEIERAIKTLSRTQQVKERICEYIMQEVSYLVFIYQYACISITARSMNGVMF